MAIKEVHLFTTCLVGQVYPEIGAAVARLLRRDWLVPDLIAREQVRCQHLPAQLVLISGSSKTADIDQTLVVGTHGLKRFIVIIYGS
jgi:hypothetical protein